MEQRERQPVNSSNLFASILQFVGEVEVKSIGFLPFRMKSAIMINNAVRVVRNLAVWLKDGMLCHAAEHFYISGNVD